MNNKLVTLIIPVYNVEKYLTRCLESVISQTYSNIQIILINDGSTDNSIKICKEFAKKDNRILIIDQKNTGVSEARNVALKHTKGEFVMFVDGDDWIEANCVEICIDEMVNNKLDLVLFPYIREYKDKSIRRNIFKQSTIFSKEDVRKKILRSLIGPVQEELNNPTEMERINAVWGKLYKYSYMNGLKFENISEVGAEDLLFNILYINKVKKAKYIDSINYHYNKINTSSITKKDNSDFSRRWFNLYKKINNFIDKECSEEEKIKFKEVLKNRIIINLFGVNLKLIYVNCNLMEKRRILLNILNKEEYKEAFKSFSFEGLGLKWKFYYFSCKHKITFNILFMLYLADKLRSKG